MTDPLDRARDFFSEDADDSVRRGRYEAVREIGRGGMAVVYEAKDPLLRRRVALKILKDPDPERLRREASAIAALSHPNIVALHEVGPDWMVMDLVRGRTYEEAAPSMTLAARLALLATVARAAGHAHARGVTHRDLKPGNVLVAEDGTPKITDFGLARLEGGEDLSRTGSVFGTPHTMAPEQVRGEVRRTGPWTDVWAIGVMLHEAVAGTKPFDGATPLEIYDRVVRADPPPLRGPIGTVISKALEKDPGRRYPDAAALATDLDRVLAGDAPEARTRGPIVRWAGRAARQPLPWILSTLAAAAFGLALLATSRSQAERERAIAALRAQAEVALQAGLEFRRSGDLARMASYLAPLESACRESSALAPSLPEPDYLRGRMHRARFEDEAALAAQETAVRKDPAYSPARYERAILLSRRLADPIGPEGAADPGSLLDQIRSDAVHVLDHPPHAAGIPPQAGLIAQGLLALAGGRTHDGRRPLEEALAADPLLEEAREVLSRCIRAGAAASFEEAERRWKEQEELLGKGLERDRGYVPHWIARGDLRFQRGSRRRHRGMDPGPDYSASEADYSEAIRLSPGTFSGWRGRGQVRIYKAIWVIETLGDPQPLLEAARSDLDRAIRIEPRQSSAHLWRGNASFYRGFWQAGLGRDAREAFREGARDLDEAVRLAAEPLTERRWRGRLRAQLGAALTRAGEDPADAFVQALEDFSPLVRVQERDAWVWMWRSTAFSERALWTISRGGDPSADFAAALIDLDRAVALDPRLMEAWKHRGFVRWHRARWLESREQDARADYAAAAADFLEALSLNPVLRHQVGDRAEVARRKAAGSK